MEMSNVLKLKNLTMQFGGLKAVNDLTFDVNSKEIVGLIGPNGAGKTTVFNCMTQFYKNYTGEILYTLESGEVVNLRDYKVTEIVDLGIVRTFQNIDMVPDLSVIDNVLIGGHRQFKTNLLHHLLKTPNAKREENELREKARKMLAFLKIEHLADFYAGGQPYGVLKRIEIARALMASPRLIILDEPAAGLNDKETDELQKIIYRIREEFNASILLIEHDMGFVMGICDRVCAINFGSYLAMDIPKNIQNNQAVQEAYLGKDE